MSYCAIVATIASVNFVNMPDLKPKGTRLGIAGPRSSHEPTWRRTLAWSTNA